MSQPEQCRPRSPSASLLRATAYGCPCKATNGCCPESHKHPDCCRQKVWPAYELAQATRLVAPKDPTQIRAHNTALFKRLFRHADTRRQRRQNQGTIGNLMIKVTHGRRIQSIRARCTQHEQSGLRFPLETQNRSSHLRIGLIFQKDTTVRPLRTNAPAKASAFCNPSASDALPPSTRCDGF